MSEHMFYKRSIYFDKKARSPGRQYHRIPRQIVGMQFINFLPILIVIQSGLRFIAGLFAAFGLATSAIALTEMPQLLQEGIPIRDLDGLTGSEVVYRVIVPPGSTNLKFSTYGGWGDCDIYARFGAHPDTTNFDQASKSLSTKETMTVELPHDGVWYVMLHGYAAFSGVSLIGQYQRAPNSAAIPLFSPGPGKFSQAARIQLRSASRGAKIYYTTDGTDPTALSTRYRQPIVLTKTVILKACAVLTNGKQSPIADGTFEFVSDVQPNELQSGVPAFSLAGNHGNLTYFKIHVGAGEQILRISSSEGSGSSAIYLSYGTLPTTKSFDRRVNGPRNVAQIEVNNPTEGDWYVAVRGVTNYSGVALLASTSSRDADLIVWAASLKPYVTQENFLPGDCSVVEGLINAGPHRLLRFTTESRNIGQANLIMGSPVGNPAFEYAPCHGHYHFKGFAAYRLL
ncbi:MAG: hypothetical protein JWL90_1898, partial [Chthoniobacteraceae bacterium]|nr:hypothetical protein [Chthoniobacteraceae bacterium]